jgi:hypothetical protein
MVKARAEGSKATKAAVAAKERMSFEFERAGWTRRKKAGSLSTETQEIALYRAINRLPVIMIFRSLTSLIQT